MAARTIRASIMMIAASVAITTIGVSLAARATRQPRVRTAESIAWQVGGRYGDARPQIVNVVSTQTDNPPHDPCISSRWRVVSTKDGRALATSASPRSPTRRMNGPSEAITVQVSTYGSKTNWNRCQNSGGWLQLHRLDGRGYRRGLPRALSRDVRGVSAPLQSQAPPL